MYIYISWDPNVATRREIVSTIRVSQYLCLHAIYDTQYLELESMIPSSYNFMFQNTLREKRQPPAKILHGNSLQSLVPACSPNNI